METLDRASASYRSTPRGKEQATQHHIPLLQGQFASEVHPQMQMWRADSTSMRNEEKRVEGTVYVDVSCQLCTRARWV